MLPCLVLAAVSLYSMEHSFVCPYRNAVTFIKVATIMVRIICVVLLSTCHCRLYQVLVTRARLPWYNGTVALCIIVVDIERAFIVGAFICRVYQALLSRPRLWCYVLTVAHI